MGISKPQFLAKVNGVLLNITREGLDRVRYELNKRFQSVSGTKLDLPEIDVPKLNDLPTLTKLKLLGRQLTIIGTTMAMLAGSLTTFVSEAHALSKDAKKDFVEAIVFSKQVKELTDKTIDLSKKIEEGTATAADSTATNKNLEKINAFSDSVRFYFDKGKSSMVSDFHKMIASSDYADVREDAKIFKWVAEQINKNIDAKTLEKSASELKDYVDELVQKRIIVKKTIEEANSEAKNGNYSAAKKKANKALKILDEYPHLTLYVYTDGVVPLLIELDSAAVYQARNGNFDKAESIIKDAESIAKHEHLAMVAALSDTSFIKPMREGVAYHMLNSAKYQARNNNFDTAEKLVKRAKKNFAECDSLLRDAENKIFNSRISLIQNRINNSNYPEAKKLIEETRKKYHQYDEEGKKASYYFGERILDSTERLVRDRRYDEALKFLKYWEKHHFNGRMDETREELARIIEIHAQGAATDEDAERTVEEANKFKKEGGRLSRVIKFIQQRFGR